jgi:hypothetical protein
MVPSEKNVKQTIILNNKGLEKKTFQALESIMR